MSNRSYTWEEKSYDHSYDDILPFSRPVSKKHPPMPMEARAAQFSPYNALVGYSDEIKETARLTDGRVFLSTEEQNMLSAKIAVLVEEINRAGKYGEKPAVSILYFVPDKKKDGGSFHEVAGTVRRVDIVNRIIVIAGKEKSADGVTVKLEDVVDISGEVFADIESAAYTDE